MIILNKNDIRTIIENCKDCYPFEACGILAGRNERVSKVYITENIKKSRVSYMIEPSEQLKIFNDIEKNNMELLGIYHSHTFTEAYPSPTDLELAFYPDSHYVIVSLKDLDTPIIKAFKTDGGLITEEEIYQEEDE